MKKSLVVTLALVFVLGIAGTAFAAANPFVDVPAKHWAYDAVAKLANAGIVDGYNDGTFRGDKTMTRYEMAQIVAKAMVKSEKADAETKALVDKLAVEFNAELQNLGVRVSKLEKNASTIKFTGDIRIRHDNLPDAKDQSLWKNRYRLNMTADVNDKTSLYARYMYTDHDAFGTTGDTGRLSDMALTTKGLIGNTDVTVGRYSLNLGPTTNFAGTTGNVDGLMTKSTFGKANLMLGYADAQYWGDKGGAQSKAYPLPAGTYLTQTQKMKDIYFAEANYAFTKNVKAGVTYFKNRDNDSTYNDVYDIFGGNVVYQINPNWKLIGEYYVNKADDSQYVDNSDPKAVIARLSYKGMNAKNPGSWGALVEYGKYEGKVLPYAMTGAYIVMDSSSVGVANNHGLKSWNAQVNYTLAKNVTFEGIYQFNIKDAYTGNDAPSDSFTRAQVNFLF